MNAVKTHRAEALIDQASLVSIAEEERCFDAEVVPGIAAAGGVNAANEEAACTVGAEGGDVRVVATAGSL